MILYADNLALHGGDENNQNLKTKTETEFQKIENWIKSNRLSSNYKKNQRCCFFSQINYKHFFVGSKNGKIYKKFYQVP